MKSAIPAVCIAVAMSLGAASANAAPSKALTERQAKAESRLAKALEGRVAGEPVRCLRLTNIRSSQVYDRTAIVYEGLGGVLYVNRPRSGAQSLDRNDVLVTRTSTGDLCSIDIVSLWDPNSRMQSGFVGLGEFVPYKKVARAN
ncbi:hypothetical protein P7B02_07085 [Caulobacter segnis]|uniref:hypothetical protein n=1 Tax=Caulobacter segnis TaxID=88688 RepID=UPI00240F8741|nr:hypothetical protein [Caulobacter segnis]MDG2521303.1 hypothetical protein [Caulobacter segnis]